MQEPTESFIIKYIHGELSEEEARLVKEWAERSEENRHVLAQLAYIYEAERIQKNMRSMDVLGAFERTQGKLQARKRVRLWQRITVAASLLIGIIGAIYLWRPTKTEEANLITISAENYLRKPFHLPDGTVVWLNAGSSLSYRSDWRMDRQVRLEGEAYFEVAQNARKPFIVLTGNGLNIEVLGTAFNVTAYEQEQLVQATLISGSIAVHSPDKTSKTILKPSEKAVYSRDNKKLKVVAIDAGRETDWMQRRLVFRDTPMREVMNRLARFYDVAFEVRDSEIDAYTFTGIFEDKPLSQVLDYMTIASNIRYTLKKSDKGRVTIALNKRK